MTDDLQQAREKLLAECDKAGEDLRKWVRVPVRLVRAALAAADAVHLSPTEGSGEMSVETAREVPSEDERYNRVYDIITDVLDEYTDMGVRHEVAVEIIDRVRKAGAWPVPAVPTEDAELVDELLEEAKLWRDMHLRASVADDLIRRLVERLEEVTTC